MSFIPVVQSPFRILVGLSPTRMAFDVCHPVGPGLPPTSGPVLSRPPPTTTVYDAKIVVNSTDFFDPVFDADAANSFEKIAVGRFSATLGADICSGMGYGSSATVDDVALAISSWVDRLPGFRAISSADTVYIRHVGLDGSFPIQATCDMADVLGAAPFSVFDGAGTLLPAGRRVHTIVAGPAFSGPSVVP